MANIVSTRTEHWQMNCLNWGKEKVPFEIHHVQTANHLMFCNEFSAAFGYQYRFAEADLIATFLPAAAH